VKERRRVKERKRVKKRKRVLVLCGATDTLKLLVDN